MNRVSIALVWFILLANIAHPIDNEFNQNISDLQIYEKGDSEDKFVALVSDSDCNDHDGDGICDKGGMPGLKLNCCSDGEIFALVAFIVIFIGIPSYLLVRKMWKFIRRRIYLKSLENEVEEEIIESGKSLGSHLPVTEKELFEFRVKEIKKRRKVEELGEENKSVSISMKEELILLSSFLFVIYLFWNNGL